MSCVYNQSDCNKKSQPRLPQSISREAISNSPIRIECPAASNERHMTSISIAQLRFLAPLSKIKWPVASFIVGVWGRLVLCHIIWNCHCMAWNLNSFLKSFCYEDIGQTKIGCAKIYGAYRTIGLSSIMEEIEAWQGFCWPVPIVFVDSSTRIAERCYDHGEDHPSTLADVIIG